MRVSINIEGFKINNKDATKTNTDQVFKRIMQLVVERFYIALRQRIPIWSGMSQASTLPLSGLLKKKNLTTGDFNPTTLRENVHASIRQYAIMRAHGRQMRGMAAATFIDKRMKAGEEMGEATFEVRDGVYDFNYFSTVPQFVGYDPRKWFATVNARNTATLLLQQLINQLTAEQIVALMTKRKIDVRNFIRPDITGGIERP